LLKLIIILKVRLLIHYLFLPDVLQQIGVESSMIVYHIRGFEKISFVYSFGRLLFIVVVNINCCQSDGEHS